MINKMLGQRGHKESESPIRENRNKVGSELNKKNYSYRYSMKFRGKP